MSSIAQTDVVPSPSISSPPTRCPRGDEQCPHPVNDSIDEIEFKPNKKMVDWLDPAQLARTGMKAANAATFGSYADKRELQAALADISGVDGDYSQHQGDLWFDYAADMGDGFDATYSVARLLSEDLDMQLGYPLRRGRFVVLGGDQVYPTASRDEYQNRFLGPFRAALPYVVQQGEHPHMYAVPGNHDWYDGLTSFLRIFCQKKSATQGGRWIGGWETNQRRSYFAIRLPNDWWIWAIDSQLESDMDHPQLLYFDSLVAEMLKDGPPSKHKIILLAAEPGWVHCASDEAAAKCRRNTEAFNTLAHFEKKYVRARGFQLKLVLSGDLHHYVRYAKDGEGKAERPAHTVRITAGGGGAYLLGTEEMPSKIRIREGTRQTVAAEEPLVKYEKASSFPDAGESRKLKWGIWKIPWQNKGFGLLLGAIYLLFSWLLQTGSRATGVFEKSLLDAMLRDALTATDFARALLFTPLSAVMALLIIFGMYAFTASSAKGHPKLAKVLGALHGPLHLALALALMWGVSWGIHKLWGYWPGSLRFDGLFTVGMMVFGWLLGGWLFAAFVFLCSALTGVHQNEVFSGQYLGGYKNLLRLRLSPNGELTVHSIGLRNVPNDWEFLAPGNACGRAWFTSQKAAKDDYKPHLIETFTLK